MTTKTVNCPQCQSPFERPVVIFNGREILADRGCLCDTCEETRKSAILSIETKSKFLAHWERRVPEDYHYPEVSRVSVPYRPALAWRPDVANRKLGIAGPPGTGKSMVAALVSKRLEKFLRWVNGFSARATYNKSVTGEGNARKEAEAAWDDLLRIDVLVLDDVDKGTFTEAWASALFELLEQRNSTRKITIWTANHLPGQLSAKFTGQHGDKDLANAIERRLCQAATIITA